MSEVAAPDVQEMAGPETTAAIDVELDELLGGVTVEMLRETFDRWTIGETSDHLLAIRSGAFTAVGPRSLIRGCVMADSTVRLAEQLSIQAWLESLSGAELEAVWRDGLTAIGS